MKDRFFRVKNKVSEEFNIPKEIILDLPKIVITGKGEITIENHKGIVQFSKECIKLNSKIGVITIQGNEFEICYIGDKTIIIIGSFEGVYFGGEVNG